VRPTTLALVVKSVRKGAMTQGDAQETADRRARRMTPHMPRLAVASRVKNTRAEESSIKYTRKENGTKKERGGGGAEGRGGANWRIDDGMR